MTLGWWGLVIVSLATYRATRLLTTDSLTENARASLWAWAFESDGTPRAAWRTYVYELVSCPWCLGVWIAAGFYVLWCWSGSPAVKSVLVILALAGVQGFLASRADA